MSAIVDRRSEEVSPQPANIGQKIGQIAVIPDSMLRENRMFSQVEIGQHRAARPQFSPRLRVASHIVDHKSLCQNGKQDSNVRFFEKDFAPAPLDWP